MNKVLQEYLNPNIDESPEKISLESTYRKGDRIMQIKNNYDIYWEKNICGICEMGSGIFNGEIGTIEEIDDKDKQIIVKFDDEKIASYNFSELDQIEHSYAITIHKAQRK